MSKKNSSSEETKKSFSNPTVLAAIIGGIVTVIVALITVLPQLITTLKSPTQVAIPISTEPIPPTNTPIPTETEILPTATSTEISPTPTETMVPSPTPVNPGIACLNRWTVIPSDQALATPDASDGCPNIGIPGIGISTSGDELIFGTNNFRGQGLFGISTTLPENAIIRMKVKLATLTRANFWVAVSDDPTPENNRMVISFRPENGEVRVYVDQSEDYEQFLWRNLTVNTNYGDGPPYIYDIVLKTSGSRVETHFNFLNPFSKVVNLPNYLFIGYQNESNLGTVKMDITVSNLSIEASQ